MWIPMQLRITPLFWRAGRVKWLHFVHTPAGKRQNASSASQGVCMHKLKETMANKVLNITSTKHCHGQSTSALWNTFVFFLLCFLNRTRLPKLIQNTTMLHNSPNEMTAMMAGYQAVRVIVWNWTVSPFPSCPAGHSQWPGARQMKTLLPRCTHTRAHTHTHTHKHTNFDLNTDCVCNPCGVGADGQG